MAKKPKISLRYQQVKDAKRYFEILQSPNFTYFSTTVNSIAEERGFLKKTREKRKKNLAHNFAIILSNKVVGGVGIMINQHREYIGEIGYLVDENYWGQGIATAAVKLAEDIAFNKLKLKRIEILVHPKNKGSRRVAEKCGYIKQAILKKHIKGKDGKLKSSVVYAKIKE